jgi:glycosyltransferase involved in cell wall biosynthesis
MPLRDIYADPTIPKDAPSSRLVVVLPAYNEALSVAKVIRQIRDHLEFQGDVEIVVVDDGSSDDTAEVAAEASAIVIRHRRNEGLGVAIATGIEAALQIGADIIVTMDSDGQFKGEHVSEIIAPLLAGKAEMVIGSRYLRPEYVPHDIPRWKRLLSDMLCWLVTQVCWGQKLTDVTCGFRAYTRNAAIRLNFYTRFTYTVESIIDATAKGLVIKEVPVRCRGIREHGKSRITSRFVRYLREIALIVLRRVRDSRPLLFFFTLALFFIVVGSLAVLTVFLVWPWRPSRDSAIILTGMSISIVAIITAISFLADQVLTSLRYLHSVMRMQRVNQYQMTDIVSRLELYPGVDRRVFSFPQTNGKNGGPHHESVPRESTSTGGGLAELG